uniref:Putative organ-specific protein P4-like isoform X1 n=1 Tax=Davidia involucrata TaxID=16924 RepID=A0A5B7BV51_DAVIN
MKDQPMPEAIQGLVHEGSVSPLKNKKTDCHTSTEERNDDHTELEKQKHFDEDFEPRHNVLVYNDGTKLTEEKSFVKDFEPRPNLSVYHDDAGLKEEKSFDKDFEPRPNLSVYQD